MYFCRKIYDNYETLLQTYFVLLRFADSHSSGRTDHKVAGTVQGEEERPIYGIAKKFNITIDELIRANPAMQKADYALQKGDQLLIPYPATKPATAKLLPQRQPTLRLNAQLHTSVPPTAQCV